MKRLEWVLTFLLLAVVILVLLAYTGACDMTTGYPDWTRAVRLIGIDADGEPTTLLTDADGALIIPIQGADSEGALQPVLVDGSGRIIMVAYGTIDVGGELDVNQVDSIREVQGAEGANLRTLAVDTNGQLIMVPRGSGGNYMAVDASGFLTTVMKGTEGENLRSLVVDANGNLVAVMQGLEGANKRTIAVDASGQIIMVPRGQSGHYLQVDDAGNLVAVIKGEIVGGALTHVRVDAAGQMIMVPRGSSGNYMAVDASGYLTTVMKGTEGETLRSLVVDSAGNLVAVMKGLEGSTLRTIAVDSSGQIIMVPRGSGGNYMAIDSDGYITAVLKGLHDSALTTIALDSAGRIYGYQVDDLDQWGETLLVGNAEQAARLGSPVSWDRRGQVQAVFDFAKGFHGVRQVTSGAGAAIELSPEHSQFGGYSVKLTGGSDVVKWAGIAMYMGVPPADVWGCSIGWSAEASPAYLELRLTGVISETAYYGYIRYDFANSKFQYRNTSAVWTDIGTKDLEIANYIWHRMKVVIDIDNEVFVRALLNNTQYDMSAATTTGSATGIGDYALCEVYCISDSGHNDIIYLDTLIFTVKEQT